MKRMRRIGYGTVVALAVTLAGCTPPPPPYGAEQQMFLPGNQRQTWAIAPAVNLSGQKAVDPILQADLVYQQMQQVHGLTVIPVNRVVEVYAGLHIDKVQSPGQAALVCDALGCDALVVPTITAYDPYEPPKLGAALQLLAKPSGFVRPRNVDVRELSRQAAPADDAALPPAVENHFLQAVGMYDAANGSVRDAVNDYARGRCDPAGPLGNREYLTCMDKFCGFAYASLTGNLLRQIEAAQAPAPTRTLATEPVAGATP